MTVEQLEAEALKLPLHERAQLAERLLASLGEDPEIAQAWEDVAEQRYRLYLAGEMQTVSASDALAEIRAELNHLTTDSGNYADAREALFGKVSLDEILGSIRHRSSPAGAE